MNYLTLRDQVAKSAAENASRIYYIAVDNCRAPENLREDFVHYINEECERALKIETSFCAEFRFVGALGFGGKIKLDNFKWFITYYHEDETPERLDMAKEANRRLDALYTELNPNFKLSLYQT